MSDVAQARGAPLQGEAALIRAVGSFALTAAVINLIVGGGIFRMPSALAAQMGAAAPLALVAARWRSSRSRCASPPSAAACR